MIGRGKPTYKKKAAAPAQEPKEKIKAGIFDDEENNFDFEVSRSSTMRRPAAKKQPQMTMVDA